MTSGRQPPKRFGRQTITFVTVTEDLTDVDRYGNAASVRTTTDVPGCHFRPLKATEKIDLGDAVSDLWKAACPPAPAVLAAQAKDEVVVDGVTYRLMVRSRFSMTLRGAVQVHCDREASKRLV